MKAKPITHHAVAWVYQLPDETWKQCIFPRPTRVFDSGNIRTEQYNSYISWREWMDEYQAEVKSQLMKLGVPKDYVQSVCKNQLKVFFRLGYCMMQWHLRYNPRLLAREVSDWYTFIKGKYGS